MTEEELKNYISQPYWYRGVSKSRYGIKKEIKDKLIEMTSFLPVETATIISRAWHILNNVNSPLLCPICNKNLKWIPERKKYYRFCSIKCMANSDDIKKKKAETNIKKYGVSFTLKNENIKNKSDNTNILKYGTTNISNSPIIKEKKRRTFLKNYGVDNIFKNNKFKEDLEVKNLLLYGVKNPLSSDIIKNKIKETNIKKYGVSNPIKNKKIKEKRKNTNLERYSGISPLSNLDVRNKIKETNIKKYGVPCVASLKKFHSDIKEQNMKVYGCEFSCQRHINSEDLKKLENPEWLLSEHHIKKKSLTEISEELNVDLSTVSDRCKKFNIEINNYYMSIPEKEIFSYLNKHQVNNLICRYKKIIYPYELDIYLPDYNLAIEFNGLYWHSEIYKDKNYHYIKYDKCKETGIKLIQIFEDEWKNNKELIKNKLLYFLNLSKDNKIYARKTNAININHLIKQKFFNKYHIQGDGPSSINYGLEFNNELVAAIGFIKNNDNSFTLNRYATSCNVVGGFSKLLTNFEREYYYPKIITFADLRWSEGDLYYKTGFKLDKILKPDYYWVKGVDRFHKFNFRHSAMKKKLENYDSKLSETENMHNHGFFKIYDAGKLRFTKN